MEAFFSYLAEGFDLPILLWIREHLFCAFGDAFFPIVTLFGEAGIFWIALSVVMIIIPKTRRAGFGMGLALIFGLIVCNITIKPLAARIRPYAYLLEHHGIETKLLVKELADFSFPSGHTIASFEASVVLVRHHKKLGIPAVILAVLISVSRLYLQVHYPTDVLVAMVLGIAFAFLADFIVGKLYTVYYNKKAQKA